MTKNVRKLLYLVHIMKQEKLASSREITWKTAVERRCIRIGNNQTNWYNLTQLVKILGYIMMIANRWKWHLKNQWYPSSPIRAWDRQRRLLDYSIRPAPTVGGGMSLLKVWQLKMFSEIKNVSQIYHLKLYVRRKCRVVVIT